MNYVAFVFSEMTAPDENDILFEKLAVRFPQQLFTFLSQSRRRQYSARNRTAIRRVECKTCSCWTSCLSVNRLKISKGGMTLQTVNDASCSLGKLEYFSKRKKSLPASVFSLKVVEDGLQSNILKILPPALR